MRVVPSWEVCLFFQTEFELVSVAPAHMVGACPVPFQLKGKGTTHIHPRQSQGEPAAAQSCHSNAIVIRSWDLQ